MPLSRKVTDALGEQRLAELSDDEFESLVTRTRPPRLPDTQEPRATSQQKAVDALNAYRKGR